MLPSAAYSATKKRKRRRRRPTTSPIAIAIHAVSAEIGIVISAVAASRPRAETDRNRKSKANLRLVLPVSLLHQRVKVARVASAAAEIVIATVVLKARQPSPAIVRSARMRSARVAETSHVATALAETSRARKNHVRTAVSKPEPEPMMRLATLNVAVVIVVRRTPISDVAVHAPGMLRVAS